MPDWSYHTVFRPVLFRLPFPTARDLCLKSLGRLARMPGGRFVIDLLGHMRPDRRLTRTVAGLTLDSPIGLAAGVDSQADGIGALSRFGFGLIETGPVSINDGPGSDSRQGVLNRKHQTIHYEDGLPAISPEQLRDRLTTARCRVPVFLRVCMSHSALAEAERRRLLDAVTLLRGQIHGITLAIDEHGPADGDFDRAFIGALREAGFDGPILKHIRVNADAPPEMVSGLQEAAFDGVILDASQRDETRGVTLGRADVTTLAENVRCLRESTDADFAVMTCGSACEPGEAIELLDAGADVVLIDAGLVFAGPGLPKRINEAVLATPSGSAVTDESPAAKTPNATDSPRVTQQSWFWTLLLSLAMLGGGLLAMGIATTRVLLPYDETLVGVTLEELCGVNENLLPFLTHDRVTLAGTMLCDGILYLALSVWGIRAGFHWARVALLTSALVGFFGFFLFLGFGYFDPFHAFVTAVMFQFTLLAMQASYDTAPRIPVADLHNDRAWRMHQWGQLLYVLHGGAIIVAGIVISSVGVTTVFVQDDLDFMGTTAETLQSFNRQLVPMIAHDRASFGSMLISCGLVVLLSSLWGFRRGTAWLWWAILLAGSVAYVSTIAVHLAVGYTSLKHLLPAYAGLGVLFLSSALSHAYLTNAERR